MYNDIEKGDIDGLLRRLIRICDIIAVMLLIKFFF